MAGRRSVVLVTVDCLRSDHVGFMGYDRPTTPFLDSLAEESFVVPAAIVAGAPTYYSVPSILAARNPLALGRDVLGLAPGEPNLASTFKSEGYATAAFCAANPYISARFGYEQGFDTFRDYLETPLESSALPSGPPAGGTFGELNRALRKVSSGIGLEGVYESLYFQYCQRWASPRPTSIDSLRRFPSADVIVRDATEWLSSVSGKPFFLWLHLMDPHSPYYPVEKALALLGHSPISPFHARYVNSFWNRSDLSPKGFLRHRDEVVSLYDAGIRWVDAQLRELVKQLQQDRVWEDCILALTADHGEEFLEHGGRYHPPSRLSEELIHVPLLLRVPGTAKREVPDVPFSLVNLAPTLLDAAAVPNLPVFESTSKWQGLQAGGDVEGMAISECVAGCTNPFQRDHRMGPRILSVRERRFKLVVHFEPCQVLLYDLQTDPTEQEPIPQNSEKGVRRRLLEAALAHVQRSLSHRDETSRVRAQLRDLQLECATPESRQLALASQ